METLIITFVGYYIIIGLINLFIRLVELNTKRNEKGE